MLDDAGAIVKPSLTELSARIVIRYKEVHGKTVPYRRLLSQND